MVNNRAAIVTGGASGIGLAVARQLLTDGWSVLIADRSRDSLTSAANDLNAFGGKLKSLVFDVASEAEAVAAIADCERDFAPVRGLVNSAGIGRDVPFFDTSAELFRSILDINLVGSFVVAREAAKLMRANGGGAIVNISSVSGQRGNPGRTAYGASKGGVIAMTQVMAVELAAAGIRVNAIAPGPIDTPLVKELHTQSDRTTWLRSIPQARYGTPEDVANAAAFLLDGSRSGFVTGHVLNVDGGFAASGLQVSDPS